MTKTATLYRMVTPHHICPFGIKSKDLLERQGYRVEDHHLTTRQETDALKKNMTSKPRRKPSSMTCVSAAMTRW